MKLISKYAPDNKPFLLGFLISLIGALPLGYINVISLQLLLEKGNWATFSFILGIVTVEYFVLILVSKIAKWLVEQKKLLLLIDVFTMVFFWVIGFYFLANTGNNKNFSLSELNVAYYPFALGLLLNCLNFIQWPYWSGIFIVLFRTEKLKRNAKQVYIFVIGALLGTFLGMLTFAYSSKYLIVENNIEIHSYLNIIFASLFFTLAFVQMIKMIYKKRKLIKE
jgi:threonine/homoserine/homoserine lactone efflux protein